MGTQIIVSQWYYHGAQTVAGIESELVQGLNEVYHAGFGEPRIHRGNRTLRNLFLGQWVCDREAYGIRTRATLGESHDNEIYVIVNPVNLPALAEDIRKRGITTVDELIKFLKGDN